MKRYSSGFVADLGIGFFLEAELCDTGNGEVNFNLLAADAASLKIPSVKLIKVANNLFILFLLGLVCPSLGIPLIREQSLTETVIARKQ